MDFYTNQIQKHGFWWSGDFPNWEEANKECIGYSDNNILEKVKNTILSTKDRTDVYERDGCTIHGEPTFAFEILEWVKKTSKDNKVNLIDFGGSLGSTYFQLKNYLNEFDVSWNVVEQQNFVKCGKQYLENNSIKFFNSIEECLSETTPNCFFSSGALPYIENSNEILNEVFSHNFDWIFLDRISTIDGDRDRITIQIVPPEIYKAIYPCWFFGEEKLIRIFEKNGYEHIKTFEALGGNNFAPKVETSSYKGYIFKKLN
jgi:putative methyltransferase (TIGR04325 family)